MDTQYSLASCILLIITILFAFWWQHLRLTKTLMKQYNVGDHTKVTSIYQRVSISSFLRDIALTARLHLVSDRNCVTWFRLWYKHQGKVLYTSPHPVTQPIHSSTYSTTVLHRCRFFFWDTRPWLRWMTSGPRPFQKCHITHTQSINVVLIPLFGFSLRSKVVLLASTS